MSKMKASEIRITYSKDLPESRAIRRGVGLAFKGHGKVENYDIGEDEYNRIKAEGPPLKAYKSIKRITEAGPKKYKRRKGKK